MFVGREWERAELAAALDDARGGRGRLILVTGEPGIGKTALAEHFDGEVHAAGGRAVLGMCREGGGAPPFWPWTLSAFASILAACRDLLRPGGVAVVTARPYRRSGELVDLPAAVLRCGDAAGLIPYERNVALLAGLREDRLVPRASFFALDQVRRARRAGRPLQVIAHEDVLVFRRQP